MRGAGHRNADGLGWRVRGGVYEHGPARLRLQVPAAWRVADDDERIEAHGLDVDLALAHDETGIEVTVQSEPFAGDARAYERSATDALDADEFRRIGRPVRWPFLGGEVALRRLQHEACGEDGELVLVETLVGGGVVDGRGYQVSTDYAAEERAAASPLVEAVLCAFEPIDRAASAALVAELERAPDRRRASGPDFTLRDGVYVDTAHGVRWTRPAGLWHILVGEAAEDEGLAQLVARHLVSGQSFRLELDARPDDDPERPPTTIVERGTLRMAGVDVPFVDEIIDVGIPARRREATLVERGRRIVATLSATGRTWVASDPAAPFAAVERVGRRAR